MGGQLWRLWYDQFACLSQTHLVMDIISFFVICPMWETGKMLENKSFVEISSLCFSMSL